MKVYEIAQRKTRIEATVLTIRTRITTILEANLPHAVINVKIRRTKVLAQNKKKRDRGRIVTEHYVDFAYNIMDILDRHGLFKSYYIVMDNESISKNSDIEKGMNRHGLHISLVYKSKTKRKQLLEEETLTSGGT